MFQASFSYCFFNFVIMSSFYQIKAILLEGGGTHISYLSDMVTHVICDNPDNPGVSEAQELFEKPVVTVSTYIYAAF